MKDHHAAYTRRRLVGPHHRRRDRRRALRLVLRPCHAGHRLDRHADPQCAQDDHRAAHRRREDQRRRFAGRRAQARPPRRHHPLVFFIGHRGMDYIVNMLRALCTAFGTASASATLPLTMECVRENKVDERAVRFVVPLGSTVNMNRTALNEAVAAMFIAQAYGIELTIAQQTIVFVTATLAAVGAAGIPEAGLVTMVMVLT